VAKNERFPEPLDRMQGKPLLQTQMKVIRRGSAKAKEN